MLGIIKRISNSGGAASNSFLLMFVSVVTTLISIIISKLLSVNFTLYEYGTYSQALLVNTTTSAMTMLGLSSAVNYFYNKNQTCQIQQQYVSTLFLIEEIIGSVCAVSILLFRSSIAQYFNNAQLSFFIVFVAFMPLLTNLISMYQNLFVSIGKAKIIAIRNFIVSIIRLISVLFASFITRDLKTVLIVLLLLDFGQYIYFSFMFRRHKFAVSFKFSSHKIVKEILCFSIPLSIYTIAGSLANDMDKYVIGYFSNTDILAIYTNASKKLPFDVITGSFITVLIPIITRLIHNNKFEEVKQLFKSYLRLGCIFSIVCGGGCIAFSNQIMVLLYDKKYLPGIFIFIIYIIIEMVRFANATIILSATGQTKIMMFTSLGILVFNCIFDIVSYKLIGWYGPAIVTLVLTVVTTIILLHFSSKAIHASIFSLFNLQEILVVSTEAVILAFCFNSIINILNHNYHVPIVFTLAYLAIYGLCLLGLNFNRIKSYINIINQYKTAA